MGRAKRKSTILENAQQRSNSLKAISTTLDLGPGLSFTAFDQAIADTRTKLDDYNQTLTTLDEKQNGLEASEKTLSDLSSRMLAGVGAQFGKDSSQYEQAGGVRISERKRASQANLSQQRTDEMARKQPGNLLPDGQ